MGDTEKKQRAETRRFNFTVKDIKALKPNGARYNVFDAQVSGLGLTVQASGSRTFFHLKKVQGMPERTALGAFPGTSIEMARGKAAELNGKLSKWQLNDYEGPSPLEKPNKAPTLEEVLTDYIENHLRGNAKNPDAAIKYHRWQFDSYLAPLRNRQLGSIRREHVRELHKHVAQNHGGVTANRTITFLRTLYGHATHPDVALWNGANPCAKPKKFLAHEQSRARIVTREEFPKFFEALVREPHRDLRDFILLALTTGARRGTIFAMAWSQIDFERKLWIIPNPKGKKGVKEVIVPLDPRAVSVLKARPRVNEWIFPGRKTHITTVKKPWGLFLKRAGISDLTVHDLRRTLASNEGETGAPKEIIRRTIGHEEDSEATRIYDRSDRRDAVRDAITVAVDAMIKAGKTSSRKLLTAASRG